MCSSFARDGFESFVDFAPGFIDFTLGFRYLTIEHAHPRMDDDTIFNAACDALTDAMYHAVGNPFGYSMAEVDRGSNPRDGDNDCDGEKIHIT
jgi:hypothetical protein